LQKAFEYENPQISGKSMVAQSKTAKNRVSTMTKFLKIFREESDDEEDTPAPDAVRWRI
jgi:hypothetical protein